MKVKNLFILNETYPLPLDKYAEFKSRKDGCKNNPMCTNKLKFDAETFIVGFAKKHGKKIETGEESSFVFVDDEETTSNFTGTDDVKKFVKLVTKPLEANTIDDQIDDFKFSLGIDHRGRLFYRCS